MKNRLTLILAALLAAGCISEKIELPPWQPAKDPVAHYPTIYITTTSDILGPTPEDKYADKHQFYVDGHIRVTDPDGMYSPVKEVEGDMQIRWRGHSTLTMEKKSYRIKLKEKAKLLGMKGDKDWYLLANHADKTLVRNLVAMRISEICGMSWTPRMVPVDVYYNGEFAGNYMLSEHKEVGKSKVNIDPSKGDCYFEIESDCNQPVCFWTAIYREPVMFREPEVPTEEQQEQVKAWFSGFETALQDNDFDARIRTYSAYIDVPSFVNHYLVQEFAKTVDVLRKSTFLTLQKGGKLKMYHVWDFDLALGNCSYLHADTLLDGSPVDDGPEGWWVKEVAPWRMKTGWYLRMFEDPVFVQAVKDRWNEVKGPLKNLPDEIDGMVRMNRAAFDRNFERWNVLGANVWPNSWPEEELPQTYDEEIARLKDYCSRRWAWLDENINTLRGTQPSNSQ